jgi:hypothetical protein
MGEFQDIVINGLVGWLVEFNQTVKQSAISERASLDWIAVGSSKFWQIGHNGTELIGLRIVC